MFLLRHVFAQHVVHAALPTAPDADGFQDVGIETQGLVYLLLPGSLWWTASAPLQKFLRCAPADELRQDLRCRAARGISACTICTA